MARILFLYSEMMPYMEAVIASLVDDFGDEVIVVSWNENKLTKHEPTYPPTVQSHERTAINDNGIKELISSFKPHIIYVSGRMDSGYLKAIKGLKYESNIVMGMDTQWTGSPKQYLQIILRRILYKNYFTHIWVPGPRQFAYAQMLGYKPTHILHNLYSGNVNLFGNINRTETGDKKVIFLGRLELVKSVDILINAWQNLSDDQKKGWELLLIGSGTLANECHKVPQVRTTGFLRQDEIINFIQGDCVFVLPSRKEPWGVVVHEMAAAGIPLILSPEVGAGDVFLIDGYNGILLEDVSVSAIQKCLGVMLSLSRDDRKLMGKHSREMANKITPRIAAASLRSVLA